jgi:hypothetical protein
MSWFSRLFRREKLSPLRVELNNLVRSVERTERYLDRMGVEFWADGGVCCPSCGCPDYSELMGKQERREKRIAYLKRKLGS